MANILDWHCGWAFNVEKSAQLLEERGAEVFIAKGLTRSFKRGVKIIAPKPYNVFGNYIFWRGVYPKKTDGITHVLTDCDTMVPDEIICRIMTDCACGEFDLGRKYRAELEAQIGSKLIYDNPIHPFHGREIEIVGIDANDNLIAQGEILGSSAKFVA